VRAALLNKETRTGDLGGQANTQKFTDAVCRYMDMSPDASGVIRAMD
jgi:isocitrate/isopropylmalate dehydrogenase